MKTIVHRANERGHANHGWLDSHHSFSFAHYYDPARIHFGALRVLNDDIVQGGMGFGTHPHDNMEIISIPLSGDLEHKDSMGNTGVIRQNDVQIMSAGTGIQHSEYNKNRDRLVNFLQVWVFPKKKNIAPHYDQKTFLPAERVNKLQEIVSPGGSGVRINQDAWFYLADLEKGKDVTHKLNLAGNGVYLFVIDGDVNAGGTSLGKRDAVGVWETDSLTIKAENNSKVLLMEVPMS